MHHWLYLAAAILFEVAGTTSMKLAQGFTRPLPSVLIFVFYALAFVALTLTLKKMDISVAYSVWSGVGTALIAAIGIFWFQEPLTPVRLACIALIVIGVVGLNADPMSR
ncbi:MAG: multidrug efflux SMR transporter [Beggiatoa sp.]|jgi:small multidrug resistance pump|nr:multidrug efflux SMR transporter [Beggiatoa sp.]